MLEHWLLNAPAMIYVKSSGTWVILNQHHQPIIETSDIGEAMFFDQKLARLSSSLHGLANKNNTSKRHPQPLPKLLIVKGKRA